MAPAYKHFFNYIRYFAGILHAPVTGNSIIIPPDTGEGYLKWFILEKGLALRYLRLKARQDLEYKLFTKDEEDRVYKMVFSLDHTDPGLPEVEDGVINFYSGESEKTVLVKRGENVCRVVLIMEKEWLRNNHHQAFLHIQGFLEEKAHNYAPAFLKREATPRSYALLKQLICDLDHPSFSPILIKMSAYTLLHNFLNYFNKDVKEKGSIEMSVHFDAIKQLEDRVSRSILENYSSLPKMDELAAEFHMSVSTMRRHFKIVFGKNIYEYYQQQRMIRARDELEKGTSNISEVARKLGFIKVGNFSRAFKKEFNISPGKMKTLS